MCILIFKRSVYRYKTKKNEHENDYKKTKLLFALDVIYENEMKIFKQNTIDWSIKGELSCDLYLLLFFGLNFYL